LRKAGVALPARSYVKWAKDALKRSNLFEAGERMTEMQAAGFFVPAGLMAQLARAGGRAGKVSETLALFRDFDLQGEALVAVLEQCQKENRLELLDGVLALVRDVQPLEAALPAAALDRRWSARSLAGRIRAPSRTGTPSWPAATPRPTRSVCR